MNNFPKITIITPSFNQAKFLEKTILSVLNQNYPNLEYIVVDGGSTDGSLEIIKKYDHQLTWWVSEKDNGQASAINKALRRSTGTWVGWQNSDDIYYNGVFHELASIANKNPKVGLIIADMMLIDEQDNIIRDVRYVKPTYNSVLAEGMVLSNQSAFWRSELHNDIGFLNEKYQYSFDLDWFLRLLKKTTSIHIDNIWGGFRQHDDTKSNTNKKIFIKENEMIIGKYAKSFWQKKFFQFRRLFLMLLNGQLRYILRGLINFLIHSNKR
jgi:glycosyltransferase involved in cell wall biosynthesis